MIDVKEATQIATQYFQDLYAEESFSNVLLEEVERSEYDGAWLITIGFSDMSAKPSESPLAVAGLSRPRRYKRFEIDAETGEVRSMKIRSVENA